MNKIIREKPSIKNYDYATVGEFFISKDDNRLYLKTHKITYGKNESECFNAICFDEGLGYFIDYREFFGFEEIFIVNATITTSLWKG